MRDTGKRKQQFLKALGDSSGVIKDACAASGISDQNYRHWRKTDPDFAAQCDLIIGTHKAQREADRRERRSAQRGERAARMVSDYDPDTFDTEEAEHRPALYTGTSTAVIRREHAKDLRAAMKARGLDTEGLEPQIKAAAALYASWQILLGDADRYAPTQTTITREGDWRLAMNPVHDQIRKHAETYTNMLRVLGLNFEAKIQPAEQDGLSDFLQRLDADD